MKKPIAVILAYSLVCSTSYVLISKAFSTDVSRPTEVIEIVKPVETTDIKEQVTSAAVTVDPTINAINKYLVGGLLEGRGEQFYMAGQYYNVNSKVLASISIHETRTKVNGIWVPGTSDLIKNTCNVAGMNWSKTDYIKENGKLKIIPNPREKYGWYIKYTNAEGLFVDAIEESIYDMARRLSWFYIEEGRISIDQIGLKWAPPKDARNGIGGMQNSSWIPAVTETYNKIANEVK